MGLLMHQDYHWILFLLTTGADINKRKERYENNE